MSTIQPFARLMLMAVAIASLVSVNVRAADDPAAKEKEFIAILQSGQPADKALACKQLAIYGGKDAVPELAKLLADEQLASWARIALESIPDPSAGEALRKAAETVKGRLLVGTLNSIGVRRDAASVGTLTGLLADPDAAVASAAAVALGRIGNARRHQNVAASTRGCASASAIGRCRRVHPVRRASDARWQTCRRRSDLR